MSGFEIAGMALGAFPIAVGGLNHFLDGVQTIKYWRRYRLKLRDYAVMLETHRTYYLDTLDELLTGIVQSDDEMEELMSQPGGALWKQPRYQRHLKQRLGQSYQAYMRTLTTMHDSLGLLCEKLGVDMSGKVLWDDYSMVEREMKRIKVTLLKGVYKELLDEIDKANKDIRDMTHQSIYLEPIRRKRQGKRPIAELRLIREYAASLYQVFVAGKSWRCSCKDNHIATLRLEPRPKPLNVAGGNYSRFRIILSMGLEDKACPPSDSQWQEIEVVPSPAKPQAVGSESQKPPGSVRFATEPNPALMSLLDDLGGHDHGLITDLCTALCTSRNLEQAVGFLMEEENERKHYVYRAKTDIGSRRQSKSLSDLFNSTNQESFDTLLLRGDRLRIAVTLASSVLQLNGTAWLGSGWTSNDIMFHNNVSQEFEPDYSHAYLPWISCTAQSDPCSLASLSLDHRCPTLLALGLTLVELCFGRTLETMHKAEDGNTNEFTTKLQTATRLLRKVYQEMGPSYGDVVRRCVLQPFDVLDINLDNEELQQKVFDDIITPLVDDLDDFNGKLRVV